MSVGAEDIEWRDSLEGRVHPTVRREEWLRGIRIVGQADGLRVSVSTGEAAPFTTVLLSWEAVDELMGARRDGVRSE